MSAVRSQIDRTDDCCKLNGERRYLPEKLHSAMGQLITRLDFKDTALDGAPVCRPALGHLHPSFGQTGGDIMIGCWLRSYIAQGVSHGHTLAGDCRQTTAV